MAVVVVEVQVGVEAGPQLNRILPLFRVFLLTRDGFPPSASRESLHT